MGVPDGMWTTFVKPLCEFLIWADFGLRSRCIYHVQRQVCSLIAPHTSPVLYFLRNDTRLWQMSAPFELHVQVRAIPFTEHLHETANLLFGTPFDKFDSGILGMNQNECT